MAMFMTLGQRDGMTRRPSHASLEAFCKAEKEWRVAWRANAPEEDDLAEIMDACQIVYVFDKDDPPRTQNDDGSTIWPEGFTSMAPTPSSGG